MTRRRQPPTASGRIRQTTLPIDVSVCVDSKTSQSDTPPAPLPPALDPLTRWPSIDPPDSLAVREVLSLPPVLLAGMPEATTLALRTLEGAAWYVTTGRNAYEALRGARELGPVLTGGELGAIAVAAELGRASSLALAEWLALKASEGAPRLDPALALGGLCDLTDPPARRWALGRVLRVCCARLERVAVGDLSDLRDLNSLEWISD